jgi:SAM-dependent methyltransferase
MADRFAHTAARAAARQDEDAAALAEQVRVFVLPRGDEQAVDVGCGAGALALALAPLVREVVGLDRVPELLALARERAPGNATFVEGDATSLPFEQASFDLAASMRTLHHVRRPEAVVAELARVVRPGGRILVIDQLGPLDPLGALPLERFERARDESHARLLAEIDLRHLFEANGLALLRSAVHQERRELAAYLDLAACEGDARERARALAPHGPDAYTVALGWYLLERRQA